MKSSNNSALDLFISEALKTSDTNLPPIDWSEVEVLLQNEKKSIPIRVNKKIIMYSLAAIGILIIAFSIFKIYDYYSSLPSEANPIIAPAQPKLNNVPDSSASVIKTAKIGAAFESDEEDTISTIEQTDISSIKNIVADVKITPRPDKKKKPDTLLPIVNTPITTGEIEAEKLILPDTTTTKKPMEEIINETPIVADTTSKKFSLWPKKSKNKKSKNSL
jgi:hypothetical protein